MFRSCLFLIVVLSGLPVLAEAVESVPDNYQAALGQWKQHVQQVQQLRDKIQTSVGEQRSSLQEQYATAIEEGEEALAQFTAAAENQLSQDGNHQEQAEKFLRARLLDLMARDDFEPMSQISQTLMNHGIQTKDVYEAAAIAAYMTHQTQLATGYIQEAEKKGGISNSTRQLQKNIPYLEKVWSEEKRLREAEAEADDLPRVRISTSKGDVVVELFENEAPLSVANFVHLVDQGFYDGLSFHRVLPHYVAQGGCPKGDGTGGPGYTIPSETDGGNYRRHFRGSMSMAKTSEPNSGGSQFFFTFVPIRQLDGEYTVFGRIIEGIDVLGKLKRRNPENPNAPSPDRILKAVVERRRDHEYRPTKAASKSLDDSAQSSGAKADSR